MGLENIRTSYPAKMGQRWRSCRICEGTKTIKAEIKFKSGIIKPVKGDELVAQTSGATGVIEEIELLSGSWANGNAAGYITMTSPTGLDSDGHWGKDGEVAITENDTIVTLDGDGTKKVYGLLYPEKDLIFEDGAYYCRWHHYFRFRKRREDENKISINEND